MTFKSHSPTPYWIDDDGFIASGSGDTYITVADVYCRSRREAADEMDANAVFIVRACNAHDRLLAAAKNALKFLELPGYHGAGATADAALARAIACAEGGAP
jgi:hypothetical protein